jgi:hypothetical protein
MKNTITLFCALLSIAVTHAQNYHRVYPSGVSGYDVFFNQITPVENIPATPLGYITAGETRYATSLAYRFPVVLRSDKDGTLTQPVNFKKTYVIYNEQGQYRPATGLAAFPLVDGQTVVIGNYYQTDGSNLGGVYWQKLDAGGNPLQTKMYAFTDNGQAFQVIRSQINPDRFFICGKTFDPASNAYRASVMCVDISGTLIWCRSYDILQNSSSENDEARTVCEVAAGPSGGAELAVAGSVLKNHPSRGIVPALFVQRVNPANGALLANAQLIEPSSSYSCEVFDMILVNTANYGYSFLLAGAINTYSGSGPGYDSDAWAMLISTDATTVHWNRQIYPFTGYFERNVKAIELTDSYGGVTYALAGQNTSPGMGWNAHVVRLDKSGKPMAGQWFTYGGAWDETSAHATRVAGSTQAVALSGFSWISENHGWIAHTTSALAVPCSYSSGSCSWTAPATTVSSVSTNETVEGTTKNASSLVYEWLVPTAICYSPSSRLAAEAENENVLMNEDAGFTIYPNPASSQITISLSALEEVSTVTITDISGRVVYSSQVSPAPEKQTLAVMFDENFAKGVYTVAISNSHKKQTKLLIVN